MIQQAVVHAAASSATQVDTGSLLVFMLQETESHAAYFLKTHGVERLKLLRISRARQRRTRRRCRRASRRRAPTAPDPLEAYATNLNQKAAAGEIDPLIGRAAEIERMVQVLCRRRKNNPLLVGEPGVGKTALAEGLALRIQQGDVPEVLKPATVYALDLGSLVAGTRYRGDFEERVKQVLDRLAKETNAIVFIDEIHTLVGAGAASGGAMDAGNLLKPALASGALRCIGSTTFSDVKQSFDKDRGLSRRFQKIDVLEPTEAETLDILKGLRSHYEKHHGVTYTDAALEAAVALSAKHLKDLHLPDKAIDVIDEAGAAQKLLPAERRTATIGPAEIEAVVAKMARVPVQAVSSDDKKALASLDVELRRVIFGQDAAIGEVASAIKLARSGLRVARQADRQLPVRRPDRRRQDRAGAAARAHPRRRVPPLRHVRVHGEARRVAPDRRAARLRRLRGRRAAHRRGAQVAARGAAARRDREGASGHVQHPAAGHGSRHADRFARPQGRLPPRHPDHDHQRRRARPVGPAARLRRAGTGGSHARRARAHVHARVPQPSRRDRHLQRARARAEIERVVDKQIDELRGMVAAKGITIELDPAARAWLAAKGFDRAFGARPMARLIERVIKKPLSELLLFGSLADGGTLRVVVEGGELRLQPVGADAGPAGA